jgi:YHS domain-containing protein
MLEKRAFQDPTLIGKINAQMIAVKINGDKQRELRERYQITSWPTDVFLTSTGEEMYRTTSPQDPAVYGQMVDRVALQFSDWKTIRQSQAKAEDQRLARKTSTQLPHAGQSVAGKVVGGPASYPVVTSRASDSPRQSHPSIATQQTSPSSQRNRMIENPYAAQQAIVVPSAAELGQQTQPAVPPVQRRMPTAAPQPEVTPPPTTVAPIASSTQVVAQPISSNTSVVSQPATIPNQSAQSVPNGLEGFCPVSLVHAVQAQSPNCWIDGQAEFAVRHRGRIYLCASEDHRRHFLADPDRYAPALSSYDLIHFVKTGELVDGKCEFGSFQPTTGKVFLFANPQNCAEFQNMEKHYTDLLKQSSSPERVAGRLDESPLR